MRITAIIPLIISMIISSGSYDLPAPVTAAADKLISGEFGIGNHTLSTHSLGSAQELEGRIVVLSVFADDINTKWEPETDAADLELYEKVHSYLGTATEWIESEGARYGKDIDFIWDWEKHGDLVTAVEFDADFPAAIETGESEAYAWGYIDEYIDTEALLNKYDADSIVYMMYFDTPHSNEVPSCTRNNYAGMPYPYEVCYMFLRSSGYDDNPAVFAHEMLHTFGAPDLYGADWQYGISENFASYAYSIHLNDIMLVCADANTGEFYEDRISNEITEITAYYIGWTDSSPTVSRWHLGESEHSASRV